MPQTATIRSKAARLIAAGSIAAAVALAPAAAHAAYGPGNPGTGGQGGDSGVGSNGADAPGGGGDSLPLTGGDAVGLALIGLGTVAGGTLLVRMGRRRALAEV